ncbi:MAG: LD-carboxypeptidase [Ignavibacteria bacterium RBG_16_34_14]|nr:MAG: LD-carboxypeptidase [Ignavibacteria bacterium RBG_16_34_14]
MIKPKRLKKGDLIGIISPASAPNDLFKIEKGVSYLEGLGYEVKVGKSSGISRGYLAGTDVQRIEDLHEMFRDKEVKAVICTRGGYGSPRLLDKIDYKLVARNPKIFVGYSDITALQMAFLEKANLLTFAGPMLAVDFYNSISHFTEEMFWALLTSSKKFGRIKFPGSERIFPVVKGVAKGRLIGGNLATFLSLAGTQYFPELKNRILLLEEVNEAPYRVDRMLNHLRLLGVFKKISGLILGAFTDCNEPDPDKKTLTTGEVIADYVDKLDIPVVYNFRHGHVTDKVTVPFGVNIRVNASRSIVEITESTVC